MARSKNTDTGKSEKQQQPVMTIGKYLADYSSNRMLDTAVKKWYFAQNGVRENTKENWDIIISNFLKEGGK